ncbi:Diminuto-like protein [Durusdinium trenchii]|uniref:Diminuto-like protein n=1 Tax=Durusdinium trenchii TaxID=1381693 RepID=A0ABP0LHM8_9DINO
MVELSHFLLSQGYSVPCVPELDDLTVGGLLMGCGIESTSWKYGMFNEICVAYEIVTAGGEVLKVTEESDKDAVLHVAMESWHAWDPRVRHLTDHPSKTLRQDSAGALS